VNAFGAQHVDCAVDQRPTIAPVATGIEKLVSAVLEMA
jgi:enhancing lycopene biosynthesis protein 2